MKTITLIIGSILAAFGLSTFASSPVETKQAIIAPATQIVSEKPVSRKQRYNDQFTSARSRTVKDATVLAYARWYAKRKLGYSQDQWVKVRWMWYQESRWDWKAVNPTSGAAGIAQMKTTSKISHPFRQVELGFKYIEHRYGGPDAAYAHWLKNRSY
jgi:hypothetical protein